MLDPNPSSSGTSLIPPASSEDRPIWFEDVIPLEQEDKLNRDAWKLPSSSWTQKIVMINVVVVPLLGLVAAIALAWEYGYMNGLYLGMLIGGWLLTGLGITVGYHRLLAHRAFETYSWVRKLALLNKLDQKVVEQMGRVDALESAIKNYELAYRMQVAVPELTDLNSETAETKRAYGLEEKSKGTATYGRQLLLARRLVERGVRFIEVTCPNVGHDRWDQHGNLKKGHAENALAVDQPIGALLADLKQRGLLDSTLVVFTGEFGRTPFAQGSDGRDHNQFGFSLWMAGGGVKGGVIHGATDEYGYKAIENKCEIHDLHATMMHLLGFDHTRLTFRFGGRDMRLTDVKGHVIKEVVG